MPSLHIGISVFAAQNRSGTGRYTLELVQALAQLASPHRFTLYGPWGDCPCSHLPESFTYTRVSHPWGEQVAYHLALPRQLARDRPDVFHAPATIAPWSCPVPLVLTVHDVAYRHNPRWFPLSRRLYYATTVPRGVARAGLILVDSAATRDDLARFHPECADRVQVVPLGVCQETALRPEDPAVTDMRRRYQLPEKYLLTVGTIEPRKNLVRVIRAVTQVWPELRLPLVIAGRLGWGYRPVLDAIHHAPSEAVRRLDYVPDSDLPALYAGAHAFVYCSLWEGFGLPILEAMAGGVPVLTSHTGALAEVASGAALLVDPECMEDIAAGLRRITTDTALRRELPVRGRLRAREYTWERTAQQTLATYETASQKSEIRNQKKTP